MVFVFLVRGCSRVRSGGDPILFSDSLTRDFVADSLGPLVDRKMSDIVLVAKAEMLAQQREKGELRAIFAELVRDQSLPHQPNKCIDNLQTPPDDQEQVITIEVA